jgi:hypothetical protein
MPFYYFDGKKVDYFLIVDDESGDIQGMSEKLTHDGTNTVLGNSYTDVAEVKSRIVEEWNKHFDSENDPENVSRRDTFIENLNTELDGFKLQDEAHSPWGFNEIMESNRLLKHMIEDINKVNYSEGAKQVADRRTTDERGVLNTDHDHTGYRWFRNKSMRDALITIPNDESDDEDPYINLSTQPSDVEMAALIFFP